VNFCRALGLARFFGIGAPTNTPAEIVDKLNEEINVGLTDPKMKSRISELAGPVLPGSPPTSVSSSTTKPKNGAR